MNVVELRGIPRYWTLPNRGLPLFAIAILGLAGPCAGRAEERSAPIEPSAAADNPADEGDDIISLAAYNAKADRIEDFGIRMGSSFYSGQPKTTVGFFLTKFVPIVTAVVPNTAAAKAGLRPGDRILKSEGQSTVGGLFSTGKLGKWYKIQKKKWTEVAAGKKNITWTLEIETPTTKVIRTVKLAVPTPPPHWGASIWRMPEGRSSSTVVEPGPLAELSRAVLDNGIWTLLDARYARLLGENFQPGPGSGTGMPTGLEPTGYEWRLGNRQAGRQEGVHRIIVTQFRGRTDIFLEADAPWIRGLYLTSPSGALEQASQWGRKENIAAMKAKTSEAAARVGAVPLEEARAGFDYELDFWTTKVDRGAGRWPFEVKPGYDAKTMFAVPAPKDVASATAVVRPSAGEFLKLPRATEAQQAMFSDAFGKLGAEPDRWAYTETSHSFEDKRVTVTRVDPSKPEAERCVLLSLSGKAPTPADVQQWRDDGGDTPKALGDIPPLTSIVDLKDLRVFKDETAAVVFELPIRNGNADFPAEKFQALFRVNKTYRAFEDITVRMRDSIRVAGVVKITEAGLQARFQTLDPAYPPQPVCLKGGGAARVLLVKISRDFETTRSDFKRVQPYVEPDPDAPTGVPIPIPVLGTR